MFEITRPGKYALSIRNQVMLASGMMGFDPSSYRQLVKLEKLGAMVTAPVTWKPRGPARGTHVVPFHGGFLLHTGLPNPGVKQVVHQYQRAWKSSEIAVLVHVMAAYPDEVARCAEILDQTEGVAGIELGLGDQVQPLEIGALVAAVREKCELPLLVQLPLFTAHLLAQAAEDSGADGLVIAGAPRGTERDPISGNLVGGRVYGPWLKSMALRTVGQIARYIDIPIIGSGGIHTVNDARDFIEAGARAVQIDTLLWIEPAMVEIIARHLGGLELTRAIGALADEWEPGLGSTQVMKRRQLDKPTALPEVVSPGENPTEPTDLEE